MCGINGVLAFKNSSFKVTEPFVTKMRETMVHRGPDGAGTWVSNDGRVGFGHRRLSIIDLTENAAQPMTNHDRSLWVTFNGEIYNHSEIRKELEGLSKRPWKSDHSDTEVVLRAFEMWGIECIHKFRGMFAIAFWDEKKRALYLVRDRIGIKPLYYSIHNGRITFASEIKALLTDPDQKRAINEESFYHYLSFHATPAPDTLFEGIKKLAGGTYLHIDEEGEFMTHRYWDVWDHTTPLTHASEEEVAERLLDELKTSVRYRGVSDVPVGIFLSGGIDSSTNAALFSKVSSSQIKTFSIGYQGNYDSYQNELHFARQMADQIGAEYHEKKLVLDDLFDFLPKMIHLQDEPIADPVCIPSYYVAKLARDNGVTVCQVGEGSDELFWGYPYWKSSLRLEQLGSIPLMGPLKKLGLALARMSGKEFSHKCEYLRRSYLGQPVFWGGAEAFHKVEIERLLSPRLKKKFANTTSWEALSPIYKRFKERAWEQSPLNWMSYLDLNLRLPELLLMRVDKMSMGVSLESRVPFLDHKFVELAMSIPQKMKTKNGVLKSILKKSVRGVIPDALIDRKKQGFGVPIIEWFYDRLGAEMRRELKSFCQETDLLDFSAIERLMSRGEGSRIWLLYNLALWWKNFIKQSPG
ncbi:MAG: Asparagine synthetase [glutamine-hydrolyzing] 1 [Chlamydiae bacterium]|nr:Asparagine synthetase [glutamine-hydrolyzing] 1 [Chlamydiota bacterium]